MVIEKLIGITIAWKLEPKTLNRLTEHKNILHPNKIYFCGDKVVSMPKTNKEQFQKDQKDAQFHNRRKHSVSSWPYIYSFKIIVIFFNFSTTVMFIFQVLLVNQLLVNNRVSMNSNLQSPIIAKKAWLALAKNILEWSCLTFLSCTVHISEACWGFKSKHQLFSQIRQNVRFVGISI